MYNCMVVDYRTATAGEPEVDRLFGALADPTRRDILQLVLQTEQSVSALAARYPMSFAAVQKHVAVLERAHLIHKHRQGREQLVHGDIETLRTVNQLLDRYETTWRNRISQMDRLLAAPAEPTTQSSPPPKDKRR
jgi:DNA-binding transcriptional ArsR family regulator